LKWTVDFLLSNLMDPSQLRIYFEVIYIAQEWKGNLVLKFPWLILMYILSCSEEKVRQI
jgi:hypothetical protein